MRNVVEFGVRNHERSYSIVTLKADLFLSGIVQLIGVILADKLNKLHLYKSIRKLIV